MSNVISRNEHIRAMHGVVFTLRKAPAWLAISLAILHELCRIIKFYNHIEYVLYHIRLNHLENNQISLTVMPEFEKDRTAEEAGVERPNTSKSAVQETADLEKVTDYAEEKEVFSVNQNNLEAINQIEAKRSQETQAREKELAKISITKDDVELLVNELEITRQQAELALRQSSGDVVQAIVRLLA